MKVFIGAIIICITSAGLFFFINKKKEQKPFLKPQLSNVQIRERASYKLSSLKTYAKKAQKFILTNNYNTQFCFLIDMRIPSGKKRFFVYNLLKDSIQHSGLVTHGGGSQTSSDSLCFNNIPNMHASSLGKYKVGIQYNGKFGTAYKLHGLESSNSKAFERFVVLHAHSCVPDATVHPQQICVSQGCPTVSPQFLNTLTLYIADSKLPILLWIFY